MPGLPVRKLCGSPACRNTVPCPEHTRKPWAGSKLARRLRGEPSGSKIQAIRLATFARDRWTCQACGARDTTGAYLQSDHVVELADGGHPLDLANRQTLCVTCHRKKTLAMALRRRQEHGR